MLFEKWWNQVHYLIYCHNNSDEHSTFWIWPKTKLKVKLTHIMMNVRHFEILYDLIQHIDLYFYMPFRTKKCNLSNVRNQTTGTGYISGIKLIWLLRILNRITLWRCNSTLLWGKTIRKYNEIFKDILIIKKTILAFWIVYLNIHQASSIWKSQKQNAFLNKLKVR